ncbi:hypothetical protein CENSYa_1521 [Cenarchaeum symbiosum A]|uniref:Uncharacterized protein n=1 Tax=Cenarchaeum symbiosum (strain A) TaxID=414004 RepID=A0RXS6_CENSY|nr:hypothetical protein CENSYa_1521 [Cenarchaeum symbiosum A]
MNKGIYMTGGLAAVLFTLALTPAGASFLPAGQAASPLFYGMAELVHIDGDGGIVSSQTVHNRLLDTGEGILIKGIFGTLDTGEAPRLICITDDPGILITNNTDTPDEETLLSADFDPGSGFANSTISTCKMADIDTSTDESMAVMTATFNGSASSTPNILAGQEITHLVICNQDTDSSAFTRCSAAGDAFAAINVGITTVASDDSVLVTYTYDLTSPDT